ncbi:MAG TPA: chloride channel protein, partial [Candidatus Binatia bacterium]|nr:chloride channel protein [Candidatus Binatia bacterium]
MPAPSSSLPESFRVERHYVRLVVLAVATGLLGAVGNLVFRAAIGGATWLFLGRAALLGPAALPLALVGGGVALLLLDRLFPNEVLGYGFPRFLEMLHLQGARVKRRWMVVKTLGAAISLGSGAAVGREGPIAQIGGSIGGAVAMLMRLSAEQRKVLIACGAAAGIATTFNAPLGALMFAQEIVLLGEAQLAHFSLIVVATTTAVIASRGLFGSLPVFTVPPFTLESYWECLTYALLGIVLGLLAAAYTRLFHATAARLRRLPVPRSVVLLGGLAAVGLLDLAVPGNVSDGYGVVNDALAGRLAWSTMAVLAVAKIVGSSVSLGAGAPGGVFGPIFFIGAMTGGSFRALSALLLPGVTGPRGSYALVGLGAFLAAATHAPLTAVFLLFEMTQSYAVAVPALITTILGLMVATALEPESIDTLGLTAEGKSLHRSADRVMLERIPVESVFRRTFDVV